MGRWLQKIQKRTDTTPTKPTKPGSVGFVGSVPVHFQKKKPAQSVIVNRWALSFSIEYAPRRITAIDAEAMSQEEALARLRYAWGNRLLCVWSADGAEIWKRGQA